MATKPKARRPKGEEKEKQKAQSERFIATARELELDNVSEGYFEQLFDRIVISDKKKS